MRPSRPLHAPRTLLPVLFAAFGPWLLVAGAPPLPAQPPGEVPGEVPAQAPPQAEAEPAAPPSTTTPAPRPVSAGRATPRATMMGFLEAFYEEGGMERAVAALDLSEVPEDLRAVKGPELALQLKEVLDRTRLIDPEEIPDDPAAAPYVFLSRPEGDVVIDRLPSGEWRFTAATVDAIPDLFHAVEGDEVVAGLDEEARIARGDVSPGFWLRTKVPPSLRRTTFILETWQWLGLLALALLGIVIDRLVVLLAQVLTGRWLRRRVEQVDPADLHKALRPLGIVAMAIVWRLLLPFLWLPVGVLAALSVAARFVIAAGAVWAAYRLVDIVSAVLEARAARSHNRFDDLLVPLIRKSLKVFIAAFGVVFVADTLDIEISSLLAGLGIGGLAVALAAQDAIKNLFGSLTVLLDRPFSVGDWVVIGDIEGTVEEVGFRSIRIRTFYNSLITLPNANLIEASVDNYGARQYRRWSTRLGIAYDTPPERIDAFCEGIRELVRRGPAMRKDYFHVYLNSFGESSLEILLYVFFEVPDWGEELAARHRLATDVLRLADALGVEIAFPTRTVWLHDATRGEAAEDSRPAGLDGDPAEAGRRAAAALAGPAAEA